MIKNLNNTFFYPASSNDAVSNKPKESLLETIENLYQGSKIEDIRKTIANSKFKRNGFIIATPFALSLFWPLGILLGVLAFYQNSQAKNNNERYKEEIRNNQNIKLMQNLQSSISANRKDFHTEETKLQKSKKSYKTQFILGGILIIVAPILLFLTFLTPIMGPATIVVGLLSALISMVAGVVFLIKANNDYKKVTNKELILDLIKTIQHDLKNHKKTDNIEENRGKNQEKSKPQDKTTKKAHIKENRYTQQKKIN